MGRNLNQVFNRGQLLLETNALEETVVNILDIVDCRYKLVQFSLFKNNVIYKILYISDGGC